MEVEENGHREDDSQGTVVLTRGYFDPVPSRRSQAPKVQTMIGGTVEGVQSMSALVQEDNELEQEEDDAQEEVEIWLHGTADWWRF